MLTFEREEFVPSWIEIASFDVGQQFVLLVGQKHDLDVRVRPAGNVLGGQVDGADDLQRQRRLFEVVAERELDPAELLGAAVRGRCVVVVQRRHVGGRAAVGPAARRRLLGLTTVERRYIIIVAVGDDCCRTVCTLTAASTEKSRLSKLK